MVGVIEEIDKLGRIVIPKELRQRYGFEKDVELVSMKDGILIKNQDYILVKKDDKNIKRRRILTCVFLCCREIFPLRTVF